MSTLSSWWILVSSWVTSSVWSQCLLGFAGKGEVCERVDQVSYRR